MTALAKIPENSIVDESKSIDTVSKMPRDLAVIKMENESIMSLAAAHPRDYGVVLADLKNQIAAFKSFAQSAMYAKPVGGGKFATGLSIRAAEALRVAFKFNRVRTDITPIDDDTVRVEATFVDYQTGSMTQDACIVSRWYKKRGSSQMVRHDDDRFYNVVVRAEAAKRRRDVILMAVPGGLKLELEEAVEAQLAELLDDSTVQQIVAKFSQKNVTAEMIEAHLGKRIDALTKDDRRTLLGLWNAIDQGETTVAEAFNAAPTAGGSTDKAKEIIDKVKGKKVEAQPAPETKTGPTAEDVDFQINKMFKLPTFAKAVRKELFGEADPSTLGQDSLNKAFSVLEAISERIANDKMPEDVTVLCEWIKEARGA